MTPEFFARLEAKIDRLLAQTGPKKPSGDEKVFKDPKDKYWQGESYAGSKLSECPADYLEAYAKYKGACAWANRKEGDPAKAQYADKDDATAKLATAWAEYRSMTTPANSTPPRREPAEDFREAEADSVVPF